MHCDFHLISNKDSIIAVSDSAGKIDKMFVDIQPVICTTKTCSNSVVVKLYSYGD